MQPPTYDPNNLTLETYNCHWAAYVAAPTNQLTIQIQQWIEVTLKGVGGLRQVLEIGSGSGVDADYIESRGFTVERTDAAEALVSYLKRRGRPARHLNIVTDEIPDSYDLIYCSAVLQHLTAEQMERAVKKIYDALRPGGLLAVSVSRGKSSEWTVRRLGAPRYFQHWQPDSLEGLLQRAGYRTVYQDYDKEWLRWTVKRAT
jgi:SAM-dependent methyltransferase